MAEYDFLTCDVFTDQRFGGNQLAVLPNAEGLNQKTMQNIAREFNYSETTFVTKSVRKDCDFKVRIFTPLQELPFAGHPTLGTAFVLNQLNLIKSESQISRTTFETGIGPVKVGISREEENQSVMHFSINNFAAPEKIFLSNLEIATGLNLQSEEIGLLNLMPAKINFGTTILMVPLKDAGALKKAMINWNVWNNVISLKNIKAVYMFTLNDRSNKYEYHARLFAPDLGIHEDPATGAGAAALGMYLANYDDEITEPVNAKYEFKIRQGIQIGRPGSLDVCIIKTDNKLTNIVVGGSAVLVCKGKIMV